MHQGCTLTLGSTARRAGAATPCAVVSADLTYGEAVVAASCTTGATLSYACMTWMHKVKITKMQNESILDNTLKTARCEGTGLDMGAAPQDKIADAGSGNHVLSV